MRTGPGSAVARGGLAAIAALVVGAISASCVGLLDLDGYSNALSELCGKIGECFGPAYYADCEARSDERLRNASAEEREKWLQAFADNLCLQDCISARRCLDLAPLCSAPAGNCGQTEHCCGFSSGKGECGPELSCCSPDGTPCSQGGECCTGSCDNGGCGGFVCLEAGAVCDPHTPCCSGVCNPIENRCAGDVCVDAGGPCGESFECCPGLFCSLAATGDDAPRGSCQAAGCNGLGSPCGDGCCPGLACSSVDHLQTELCLESGCLPDGLGCERDEHCCGGACRNQVCKSDCGMPGDLCGGDGECCAGQACNGVSCCKLDTAACTNNFECCSGTCGASFTCQSTTNCALAGTSCNSDNQCCSGKCGNSGSCCQVAGSHNECVVGKRLPETCDDPTCANEVAYCPAIVCAQRPSCCCSAWGPDCVQDAQNLCGIVCPVPAIEVEPVPP